MQPGTLPQPQTQQDQQQGFYRPAQSSAPMPQTQPAPQTPAPQPDQTVSWEASEYIHHSKNVLWIAGYVVIVLMVLGFSLWLGSWTFTALTLVMAVAMAVFALRPPRVMRYSLSSQGIDINNKFYKISDYRAFGVLTEGAFYSILLIPTKRFMPALTLYFLQQDGEKIVDILGNRLPIEPIKPDFLDRLMRQLRF